MDNEFYDKWKDYIRYLTPEACERYDMKIHRAMTRERVYQVFDELVTEALYDIAKSLSIWQKVKILFGKKPFIL